MQLVSVHPIPPPQTSSLSPYITSVRWSPSSLRLDPLSHDPTSSHSHLLLAAGDRQGRICLLDPRGNSTSPRGSSSNSVMFLESDKLGVQDICWIKCGYERWIIGAISGPSLLSLYETSTGRCFFKYDVAPEVFGSIARDPFDERCFVVVGLKGVLLSVKVHGDKSENDVVVKEMVVLTDLAELSKMERDVANGGGVGNVAPAMAMFPGYVVKVAFSPHWRNILYVTFPRELVVFDLQYKKVLSRGVLPRGCGKFMDVMPDPSLEVVYCSHFDGRLSAWRRKEGEQVHVMCMMEELMPSLGTPVPSPSVLAVVISRSDSTLQNVRKHLSDGSSSDTEVNLDFDNPFDFRDDTNVISKTHLLSISDDGKIWNWLLTAEGPSKDASDAGAVAEISKDPASDINADGVDSSHDSVKDVIKQSDNEIMRKSRSSASKRSKDELSLQISLVGQLHLISSAVTMLAVPSPSLTATMAGGGNHPAVAVPLVALGTQSGSVEIVDVSANAVAASFAIHDSVVRGLRWLGNSRLVSFSYNEGNEKSGGGYTNRLVVTNLRTGLNRTFRVLQKPERTPIRALRTSSSGRYLLIMFRDAPVEVWAMTKTPIMLRSLALPFTVLEWTLPTVPRPMQTGASKKSDASVPPDGMASQTDSKAVSPDGAQEEFSESFAFALANGALGVFEVHGRRIRDFKPKWPASSLVSSDGPVRAMAYRLPHVVMGDRSGNIRWWDVTSGQSSSFNTHREGIRRIKFSPVVPGDRSRGRIAVLFNDNTFSVFDLDSPDPLANSLLQPQFPGTLVLELDWLPVRTDKNDPLVLCITGADSSFRLVEVNIDKRAGYGAQSGSIKERFRPMPLCSPILLPTPHALALRLILQCGVKPSWFNTYSSIINKENSQLSKSASSSGDLRSYLIDIPTIGDSVVPELLLKVLEPYQREGSILDDERVRQYATILNKGSAARFSFAAAIFGETSEAYFWLQLPRALKHLMNNLANKSLQKVSETSSSSETDDASLLSRISSKGKSATSSSRRNTVSDGELRLMAFEQEELWESANERIPWHERLDDDEAIQNRVHELVSIGNLEAAVSLMLSTPPESPYFYPNALRAVALSSAVSRSLNELAVKVVAANMVETDRSLSGTHLLCAVGRYQEACSQLQDAGCWTDAATLAATHLKGTDYARVLHRWAEHVFHAEHNIWRALVLYIAAGSLQDALAALREAQQPDTAAMFIIACREIHSEYIENLDPNKESDSLIKEKLLVLPGLNPENEDVKAVGELYGQFQQKLVHLCMDSQTFLD
ncbi:transducin family protein / WD-40 repeat family protein [Artemisia annua]|uniref:Transducin family protein / WD-40 repeat family protein n=1 Tax=Artemisia annua TaxID=35608 RepID=A0A2U1MCG1_ARTAN|nr:transducin family protein / WD-40 repeat family protein [Artemisia annua]